jgi:hypothetical protein
MVSTTNFLRQDRGFDPRDTPILFVVNFAFLSTFGLSLLAHQKLLSQTKAMKAKPSEKIIMKYLSST